jgi:DNA ligase-1
MTERFELPVLFGLSKNRKLKQWQIKVIRNSDDTANIIVESGYVDGKIREIPKLIKKGKNIGKSNQTTPFEQAVSEAQSKWNGKRDENYETEPIDPYNYIPRIMLPQLAKGPGKGKIVYPAYIQPKLNGVCDLAELCIQAPTLPDVIIHHSRGGHLFETLEHLDKWLLALRLPAPAHGELYRHGWSLQKISGYTKEKKPDQNLLEYWLYDIAWLDTPYETRNEYLAEDIFHLRDKYPECPIRFTETEKVFSYEEAKHYHNLYVQRGFEGAMLKNLNGIYLFQYNSNDLEKVKDYQDDEFEIIGGKEGTGTDTGCIVYRCKIPSGLEFDARPRGTVEDRKKMLIDLPNDIGKMLTVRYAELSDSGVPLQPVGIPAEALAVRDYE